MPDLALARYGAVGSVAYYKREFTLTIIKRKCLSLAGGFKKGSTLAKFN
jgi:hypothetical protein